MQAIERALDVALIAMQNGGSTSMADRIFRNTLNGHSDGPCSAVWRLDFVTVCGIADGRSWTILRPVGPIRVNLVRASEAVVLSERVAKGEVDFAQIDAEIARINTLAPPYGRWTLVAAAAWTAAFFCGISGGDLGAGGIALVAAGIGQYVRTGLQATKIPIAKVTLICGVISACIAALGLRMGLTQAEPATLIASVVYMIPGLSLINGVVDVISHKHLLVGFERIADAMFLFLVLAIAIALANAVVM